MTAPRTDFRMRLNNYLQAINATSHLRWDPPVQKGPDNSPQWTIKAYFNGTEFSGTGRDLGTAKEEAARQVLESLLAA